MMQLLMLLMIFRSVYGLIYEKEENRELSAESVIHVENNVPSDLTCVHICLRLNGDALYTKKKKCRCVGKMKFISNMAPLITGIYMKKTAKDQQRIEGVKDFGRIPIKQGQKIAIISTMRKTFHIQAVFKIDKSRILTNQWHNPLRITTGVPRGSFGYANPGFYILKLDPSKIQVEVQWPDSSRSNKYTFFITFKKPSFFDSYIKVDYIQQQITSSKYSKRILLNDVEVYQHSYVNRREFENLIVYAGGSEDKPIENSTVIVRFIEGIELKWRFDE